MNTIGGSNSDEVVLEWLRAELHSARFGTDLKAALENAGYGEKIIVAANLNDSKENAARLQVLKSYREWIDIDFDDYDWRQTELSRDEVGSLLYIDYNYWNELSDHTREVKRAAANVAEGKVVFDVPNDGFFSVAKAVETGESLPPIIVMANSRSQPAEILEGHLRATGYLLARDAPNPLAAMWGSLRK